MPYKDGVFVETTNADRARYARAALRAYAELTRFNPDDHDLDNQSVFAEIVADLCCDLRHLNDLLGHGVDVGLLASEAYNTYLEEKEEERQ